MGYRAAFLHESPLSRFSRTPTCDRQTDRQTDTRLRHIIYRASMVSRGKNQSAFGQLIGKSIVAPFSGNGVYVSTVEWSLIITTAKVRLCEAESDRKYSFIRDIRMIHPVPLRANWESR